MQKIVIALGGNALQAKGMVPTAENQLRVIQQTAEHVADIVARGHRVFLTHGNGPQVGRIVIQNEAARELTPPMPFDVCGAMSQGMIGYQMQQALHAALLARGQNRPVVTLVSQTVVHGDDPAFSDPTKPIGPFYTQEQAEQLAQETGYVYKEDAGRGYRRVVPSPMPVEIVEREAAQILSDAGALVVLSGGGGVPVVRGEDGALKGVSAVIDKDHVASLLAREIQADQLIILTEVEQVFLHFGTPQQAALGNITASQAEQYAAEGHFAAGSMLPKIRAAIDFVRQSHHGRALITSLDAVMRAMDGHTGTHILPDVE